MAVPSQRRLLPQRDPGPVVVEAAARTNPAPAGGTVLERHPHRHPLCARKWAAESDPGPGGGLLPVRERLLGAAAADRPTGTGGRTSALRHSARLHRCWRRGRRFLVAAAEGEAWTGQYGGIRYTGNGGGPARLRIRA